MFFYPFGDAQVAGHSSRAWEKLFSSPSSATIRRGDHGHGTLVLSSAVLHRCQRAGAPLASQGRAGEDVTDSEGFLSPRGLQEYSKQTVNTVLK